MQVVVVQLAADIDSAANRAMVDDRLASVGSADLVVLPEATMHDFGPVDHDLGAPAEPLDGPFCASLAAHARRLGATVIGGMFERTDDLPFNTLVAFGPDGDLAAAYRKIHLYDSFGYRESDRLSAGSEPVTVDVGSGPDAPRVGLMTCYDLRFPELARRLIDADCGALVLPAAWVAGDTRDLKLRHWRTLITARAIENTVPVVAAAQGGRRYTGHSMVVDAMGAVLVEAGDDDDTLTVDLEASATADARRLNPSLANRRLDVGRGPGAGR